MRFPLLPFLGRPLASTAATALALGLGSLTAQQSGDQRYVISPPGTESLEGNSSSAILLNYASARVQQIDSTFIGHNVPIFRGLAFRRDRNLKTTAVHTGEYEVLMAHSDYNSVGTTFASNYKGTPSTVFNKKKVLLDWTMPSPRTPAEYDVVFPFDVPFVYNRADALLWECKTTTGTAGPNYSQDWYSGSSPAVVYGPIPSALGTGCTTPNGQMNLDSSFRSGSPTTFEFGWELRSGPSLQPAALFIGLAPLKAPLFCGTIEIQPILQIPMGQTSAAGAIPLAYAQTPWDPALAGFGVYSQAAVPDPSQASGVALSNGLHSRAPREPGGAHPYAIKRIWSSSATATTGATPTLSAVATKLLL